MDRHALVIDDNRQAADMLAKALTMLGFRTLVAYGPRTAIQGFTQHFPNVILIDMHMQGVEGDEVIRYLRRDPRTARVPIIAMSSDNQPEIIERFRLAGANAFLVKPIGMEALEGALRDIGLN